MKLKGKEKDVLIIQVYMPTKGHGDEKVEEIYDKLEKILDEESKGCCTIIMGDWNASVGDQSEGKIVGKYGLGKRNGRGERLIDFCKERDLVVTNTWFKNNKRRIYTWKAPGDRYRKQIDFILVQQRYRNAIKRTCGLPGADIDSDHILLKADVEVKLKRIKRAKIEKKWDVDKLRAMDIVEFGKSIEEEIVKQEKLNQESNGVENKWMYLKNSIVATAKKKIGYEKGIRPKKPWVTKEMIEKMQERKKFKRINTDEGRKKYRTLNDELRKETEKAREKWLREECDEIEDLDRRGRSDMVYKRVKCITWDGSNKQKISQEIEDKNGQVIKEINKIVERRYEYLECLYGSKDKPADLELEEIEEVNRDSIGNQILREEVEQALKDMKNGKKPGVDSIPVEMIKCLQEEGMKYLTALCCEIYDTGEWPEDFLKTEMIPLPKKNLTKKCSEHRTISLICHAAKIILRVMNKRLWKTMEENVEEEQFGFRRGMGTRDAIAVVRAIGERYIERGKELYICFVDLEKAFDCVKWKKLMSILKKKGVDWKERRLIKNLYMKQKASMKIGDMKTEWFDLGKGVRQGCCISPTLFNIYVEEMVKECWENNKGVSIGGRRIKCIRFADDMILLAENKEDLEEMIKQMEKTEQVYELRINTSKTKIMKIGKPENWNITTKKVSLEKVQRYKYLGTEITDDWKTEKEVKIRIALAKKAYKMKSRLLSSKMDIGLRKRLVKCYVWNVLLYGCEAWQMRQKDRERLEAFEMWIWRKMLRVTWQDKIRNDEVLTRIGQERELLKTIRHRKALWMGHALRKNGIVNDVLEGTVEGDVKRGRRKTKFVDDLKEGKGYENMKRRAQNREVWRRTARTC